MFGAEQAFNADYIKPFAFECLDEGQHSFFIGGRGIKWEGNGLYSEGTEAGEPIFPWSVVLPFYRKHEWACGSFCCDGADGIVASRGMLYIKCCDMGLCGCGGQGLGFEDAGWVGVEQGLQFWIKQCCHIGSTFINKVEVAEEFHVEGLEGLFHSHAVGQAILDVFVVYFFDAFWWEGFWVLVNANHFGEPIGVIVVGLVHTVEAVAVVHAGGPEEGGPAITVSEAVLEHFCVHGWGYRGQLVDDEAVEVASAELFSCAGTPEGNSSTIGEGYYAIGFGVISDITFIII